MRGERERKEKRTFFGSVGGGDLAILPGLLLPHIEIAETSARNPKDLKTPGLMQVTG